MRIVNLCRMELGQEGVVVAVTAPEPMCRRLMDMGFTRGASVRALYRAGSGDPTAYAVRGAVIALRACDAREVSVAAQTGGEQRCQA